MSRKFKVGDKVKVYQVSKHPNDDTMMDINDYTHYIGNIYTISYIRNGDMYPIEVEESSIVWRHEDFIPYILENKIGGVILMANVPLDGLEKDNKKEEKRC